MWKFPIHDVGELRDEYVRLVNGYESNNYNIPAKIGCTMS